MLARDIRSRLQMPGEGRARTGAERVEESGTQRQRDSPQRVRSSCRAASAARCALIRGINRGPRSARGARGLTGQGELRPSQPRFTRRQTILSRPRSIIPPDL